VRALIHELPGAIGAGALDIAGRTLLVRQLQWLRELGIEDVVVEVTIGSAAARRAASLLSDDPLTLRVVVIPSRSALGSAALAQRAGLPADELFLSLPADLLVHGALALPEQPLRVRFPAPSFAPQAPTRALELRSVAREIDDTHEELRPEQGWAIALSDHGTAHTLSCAVLAGQVPDVLVHAAELRPGVWLARGARVAEDAVLTAPVLIGNEARVFARAQLGPAVIVGDGSVIERDAVLSEVAVSADTLVGEAARIRNAQIDARGITSFADQARTEIDDPLQLTNARDRSAPLSVRLLALALLGFLGPLYLLGFSFTALRGRRVVRQLPWRGQTLHVGAIGVRLLDLVPALFDVVLGRRDLLGIADPRALEVEGVRSEGPGRAGALDVSLALSPAASLSTRLWMWRWYLLNKRPSLDRKLLLPALAGLFSGRAPGEK
jgi:hypothetical protein